MADSPARSARLRSLLPDGYVLLLFAMVAVASLWPVRGQNAARFDALIDGAIMGLFFLYGSRLSPRDVVAGMRDVRLHGLILACTYLLFPALGLLLRALAKPLVTPELLSGLVFLSVLPSTVQSSIAFTSIARGNVPAALCSASLSNVLGVVLTPALVALLFAQQGVTLTGQALKSIALTLLLPFCLGQLLRPVTAAFITRHKQLLGYVDRGSILMVVYGAFSEAVVSGIWSTLSAGDLVLLLMLCAVLLALVLGLTTALSRRLRLPTADEIVLVFCGSKKSMASGLPMASVLFSADSVGAVVLPLMVFHQLQLIMCAWLARRYAMRADEARL